VIGARPVKRGLQVGQGGAVVRTTPERRDRLVGAAKGPAAGALVDGQRVEAERIEFGRD
jgi:hypothetical protein